MGIGVQDHTKSAHKIVENTKMREHKTGGLPYTSCPIFEWKKIQITDLVQTSFTSAIEYKNKESVYIYPFFIIMSSIYAG